MKRILLMLAVIMVLVAPAMAQKRGEKKDKEAMRKEMMDFKLKYLAQEMELTSEQKEKFEPLYRQMSEEKMKLFRETRRVEKRVRNDKNATDADYQAVSKAIIESRQKDAEIEKQYDAQFAKFLSAKQIYKLKEAEQAFRERMRKMHKMKKSAKKVKD